MPAHRISAEIFRAYDIRGIVGDTLTEPDVYLLGRAFAAAARAAGRSSAAVGGDGRDTTPALRTSLHRGLRAGGVDVVDVGCVPTPLLYYATHVLGTGTGVMVTGSHNAPQYNGLKMMIGGSALTPACIAALRTRVERGAFTAGAGTLRKADLLHDYVQRVLDDVAVRRRLKVVVDCGNGVAGLVAPRLLDALGCTVVPLYADVDGSFPNHHPDPADAANLEHLIAAVGEERADLGLAFDGDGDRLGVVTDRGDIVWPDRTLMLFSRDIIGRNPDAAVVFDVKCSRHLPALIRACGGRPLMCKTGHTHIKAEVRRAGALLGGEFSGHFCFADRWFGFDDAIYSAARLVEILAADPRPVHAVVGELPAPWATAEVNVPTTEREKFEVMARLAATARFAGGRITDIDGIRVDYADGWGLIRPSNTSPMLGMRFEADSDAALARIRCEFEAALRAAAPELLRQG